MENNYDVSKFRLACSDECGTLNFYQFKSDGYVSISYSIPAFYAYQKGIITTIFKRINMAIKILFGMEYELYEIVIEDSKTLESFQKFVADMAIIK